MHGEGTGLMLSIPFKAPDYGNRKLTFTGYSKLPFILIDISKVKIAYNSIQ